MKVAIIGASGYVGAELISLLIQHPKAVVVHLLVSENSTSCGKNLIELYPRLQGLCALSLQSFSSQWLSDNIDSFDVAFLATPHELSHDISASLINAGKLVFDLSGAFRMKDCDMYPEFYHFSHQFPDLLDQAVYGLAEWKQSEIQTAKLVAVPGCYPTASLLSLMPIIQNDLQAEDGLIVVNGISGVSGAGRKASLATSFNEVSLTAYNVLAHRHQPEISEICGQQVIFNPHLAPYKRGLLATVTLNTKAGVTVSDIDAAFEQAYHNKTMVRVSQQWPKIDNVAHTPFADIHWKFDERQQVLVVSCAIDNLLKGAASQAVQCFNITQNLPVETGLVHGGYNVSG